MNVFERINKQLIVECEDGNVEYVQSWWNVIPDDYVEPDRTEEERECYSFALSIIECYASRAKLLVRYHDVSDHACYNWAEDVVTAPCRAQFDSDADFFGTLFHELVHSTAHKSRLARPKFEHMADHAYCEEELIAELGAMYLMGICCYNSGVNFEQSASYIKAYRANTNTTNEQLMEIAKKAMQAVDYILGD